MRSGFVTFAGRPNTGKSTLLNRILDEKVSIVSDKPQTTRHEVRGILTRPEGQIVFVDTPGLHKPRTPMGQRLNDTALRALHDVDVACQLVDATAPLGRGDQWVMSRLPLDAVVVVNKTDAASRGQLLEQLQAAAAALDGREAADHEVFPVSARTGEGVEQLVAHLLERLPVGPQWYPLEMRRDAGDEWWLAELVREQLLAELRRELPHSVACRTVAWDWPYLRVEVLVERESQKPIVVGRGGDVLKRVGTAVRRQLPDGAYLELVVKVEPNWQRRPASLDRLGY